MITVTATPVTTNHLACPVTAGLAAAGLAAAGLVAAVGPAAARRARTGGRHRSRSTKPSTTTGGASSSRPADAVRSLCRKSG